MTKPIGMQVLSDVRKVVGEEDYVPTDPRELCKRVFFTCYMGTENSSRETRARADGIAAQIGSHHQGVVIDTVVSAVLGIFRLATGKTPEFKVRGGCDRQNLALQNVQARTRMVVAYLFAQLMLWAQDRSAQSYKQIIFH